MKYRIFEKQNMNGMREAGHEYEGTSTGAKRFASHNQVWQGTVLAIENESGLPVSHKEHGKWTDNPYHA